MPRKQYDAVLFDMDGVLTATAEKHAEAWKRTFDAYLQERSDRTGEPFRPFEIGTDYLLHVDGKPRQDGVRDFLASRAIQVPAGSPGDSPEADSIWGIGNRKNKLINTMIREEGVRAYEGSVKVVKELRRLGLSLAVVTSSTNGETTLAAAGIKGLFDVLVDGNVARDENLAGKPAPDTYLHAARLLNVEPARTVVVEDAISGVQAGRNGNFGLVLGVARGANAEELLRNGADLVVSDLGELLPKADEKA
jgi:beta-phosphoglucomutase family hydrolase